MILTAFALILTVLTACSNNTFEIWTKLNTNETRSSIINQDKPIWKVEQSQLGKVENIQNFYFYDENIIYGIRSEKFVTVFYKTQDGGKSWGKLSSINDFAVNDIFFVSPTEGFIAVSKLKPSSTPGENGSEILKTGDGGLTWKSVYSSVNTTFNELNFNVDGLGILVGRRDISQPQSDSANLVLLTSDKGQTWKDVSANLNQISAKSNGRTEDLLSNVIFSKEKAIVVLSVKGKIYKTADSGNSWSLITGLADEPDQTGISHFGELENGKFWVAGGTMSIEGKWAVIAIMNNPGWDKYRLNNYYFSDFKFLSNNEVIACGFAYAIPKSYGAKESYKGVIMYSSNSGKDWETVYENQSVGAFYSISKFSENRLFVTGENGTGLILNKISKTAGQ